jgi:hypothetical protein
VFTGPNSANLLKADNKQKGNMASETIGFQIRQAFDRINDLGTGPTVPAAGRHIGPSAAYTSVPTPVHPKPVIATTAASKVTDSVYGNSAHAVKRLRPLAEETSSVVQTKPKSKFPWILLIVVLLLLVGVVITLFFVRRARQRRQAAQEALEKQAFEEREERLREEAQAAKELADRQAEELEARAQKARLEEAQKKRAEEEMKHQINMSLQKQKVATIAPNPKVVLVSESKPNQIPTPTAQPTQIQIPTQPAQIQIPTQPAQSQATQIQTQSQPQPQPTLTRVTVLPQQTVQIQKPIQTEIQPQISSTTAVDVEAAASALRQGVKNSILASRAFDSEAQRDESLLLSTVPTGTSQQSPQVPNESLLDSVVNLSALPAPVGGNTGEIALPAV